MRRDAQTLESDAVPGVGGSRARSASQSGAAIQLGDSLELADGWPSPTVIISDGPYGIGSFPGDPATHRGLEEWYRPHIAMWARRALPETTLWFWNTEVGWATVHPLLEELGWEYRSCHIWDKGIGHIAGNANTATLRKFPVITEVCAQYVRRVTLPSDGVELPLKEWLRAEWVRSGIPLSRSNEACGVRNAATRKYLTQCHMWYFPPADAFEKLAAYANEHGDPAGRPYFSADGKTPLTGGEWTKMRAKFRCDVGVTNVWRHPAVRGKERLKNISKSVHMNQKPLALLEQTIVASSDPGDVVWEPFGGLCSTAIASINTNRQCHSAELLPDYFKTASQRLKDHLATFPLDNQRHGLSKQAGTTCLALRSFARSPALR